MLSLLGPEFELTLNPKPWQCGEMIAGNMHLYVWRSRAKRDDRYFSGCFKGDLGKIEISESNLFPLTRDTPIPHECEL